MKLTQVRRASRAGFTLIELLVVVGIIAILIGLISAGVLKFMAKGPKTATRTEIGQLESAVALFHKEFGLGKEYMPSRIILCEAFGDYFNGGVPKSVLHKESLQFLQRMFPKLWRSAAAQKIVIDWNNSQPGVAQINRIADPPVLLEGDQCLVFFLGGIPTAPGDNPGCLGFSFAGSDPSAPSAAGSTRKGPYFEFKGNKLVQLDGPTQNNRNNDATNPGPNRYFSYMDAYQVSPQPGSGYSVSRSVYAYFSSYRTVNGYNHFFGTLDANGKSITSSDCATLGVWPYAESLNGPRYMSPSTFQIISAGANGIFGPGTDFSSKNPVVFSATDPVRGTLGSDDQANFNDGTLGVVVD